MHTKLSSFLPLACAGAFLCAPSAMAGNVPLKLNPINPHYFEFRHKPAVLVTSGEHYGSVINLSFDYHTYLDVLQSNGLNLTRVFVGSYREPVWGPDTRNTLSPRPDKFLAPWARSQTPGYNAGGNKFDLDHWDDVYFRRLKDFVKTAGRHGIVVEVVFFSQMYSDTNWRLSPMYNENNVNGVGHGSWGEFTTLEQSDLVARQDALIRKIVTELRSFDNVYYELSNEPYSPVGADKTREWLDHLAATVTDAEAKFPDKHLISVQDASTCDSPSVSIYNFHYAYGDTFVGAMQGVERYYDRNKPLAFDETETYNKNTPDQTRRDAWAFLLSGGATYDYLDTAFSADDATGSPKAGQNGKRYDGTALRKQLGFLKSFIESFDFPRMHPASSLLVSAPSGAKAYLLAEEGKAYALSLQEAGDGDLVLKVPAGKYKAEWWSTETGTLIKATEIDHNSGDLRLTLPPNLHEAALKLLAVTAGG